MKRLTLGGAACTETLALLITVAWADGRLDDNERAGVRGAADVLNLTKELRGRLDTWLDNPLPVDQLLLEAMTPREKAFAYVAAAWLTRVDDKVDAKEERLLDEVASHFGFAPDKKEELEAIARDLAPHHPHGDGGKSWAEDVVKLFRAIAPRLEDASSGAYEVTFE